MEPHPFWVGAFIRRPRLRPSVLSWTEFVDFVRGTRPLRPPARKRPLVMVLLFSAALVHLPLVYFLVRNVELQPPLTLAVGLIAMGLAWSGGVSLEGRRRGTSQLIAAIALGESALAFVPTLGEALGPARWLFVAIGALALGALLSLSRE